MKASGIPTHEASFKSSRIDSDGKSFVFTPAAVDRPGDPFGPLELMECKRVDNDASFYYPDVTEKKRIVIHFTAGYLKGDIAALTKTLNHVSVPFVIARDGTIYNLWESKYWSFHLGGGAVGGNQQMSASSIGIELSNIGPLRLLGDQIVTSYGANDVYCSAAETQHYQTMPSPYRGYLHYATFTEAQYKSLVVLLRFLIKKFAIPPVFLPIPSRYELFGDANVAKAFAGICSHVNFRPVGEKVDIGPAFDWDRVIREVAS